MSAQPQLTAIPVVRKAASGRDATQLLKQFAANEYVFAVVGPAGSGTSWVADALSKLLLSAGIQPQILKASRAIEAWAAGRGHTIAGHSKLARAMSLQDMGDLCRSESGDKAAVSIRLMKEMRELRKSVSDSLTASGPSKKQHMPSTITTLPPRSGWPMSSARRSFSSRPFEPLPGGLFPYSREQSLDLSL